MVILENYLKLGGLIIIQTLIIALLMTIFGFYQVKAQCGMYSRGAGKLMILPGIPILI